MLDRRSMLKKGAALLGAGLVSSFTSESNIAKGNSVNSVSEPGNMRLAKENNIIDFGAMENSLSTDAIQKAVDNCFEAGGGTVIVPAGKFITGTIVLKSRINLFLEQGAELQSSENIEDYISTFRRHGMIFCEDATEVSITGEGVINGRGSQYYYQDQNHVYEEFEKSLTRQKENYMPEGEFYTDGPLKRKPRPFGFTIEFYHCNQVIIRGITIKDTPIWATRIGYCEGVLIEGITILNNLMVPNSDGIHITVSRNMRISNCNISAGDDAIVVTGFAKEENTPGFDSKEQDAHKYGNKSIYVENIQVINCQLQSRSAGIRIGYGQHPIRRITFNNIVIYGSNRGIGIFARDEAPIEEIIFSNIIIETRLHNGQWWGNGEPIHISATSRFEGQPVGQINNIQFNNISATGEHGIILYGDEESHLNNIQLNNVQLLLKKGRETLAYGGNFDLRPTANPELRLFQHDIPALYAQNVDNLAIRDFNLKWGENLPDFFTHGIECRGVKNLAMYGNNISANPNSPFSRDIFLEDTTLK